MNSDVADKVHAHFSQFPLRKYPKGQILVFADENPDHIFYLVSGQVIKHDISYRGEEVIINIYKPPSFFPMSWVLNREPNKYFYKTDSEVELHVVPTDDALEFIEANPDVALDLLRRVYSGLEGIYGRLVHLMSGTARSRLIYELIIECRRFGIKQPDGSYLLTTSESDLAARSGLSRETVSREMTKIKAHGWALAEHNGIHIQDIAHLEEALGNEM